MNVYIVQSIAPFCLVRCGCPRLGNIKHDYIGRPYHKVLAHQLETCRAHFSFGGGFPGEIIYNPKKYQYIKDVAFQQLAKEMRDAVIRLENYIRDNNESGEILF